MAEKKPDKIQHDHDAEALPAMAADKLLSRRQDMKKVGKLAYAAPVLTVIPLSSNAQISPPSDPEGVQKFLMEQGL